MEEYLDEKDKNILEVLKDHSDYTTRQIAKKVNLPITTVHNRVRKLKSSGVIKRFTVDIDHKKIGKGVAAYILCLVDYKAFVKMTQHDLAKKISELPFVEKTDIVAGGTDIVVKVRLESVEELDKLLIDKFRHVKGIERTKTLVVLHEY